MSFPVVGLCLHSRQQICFSQNLSFIWMHRCDTPLDFEPSLSFQGVTNPRRNLDFCVHGRFINNVMLVARRLHMHASTICLSEVLDLKRRSLHGHCSNVLHHLLRRHAPGSGAAHPRFLRCSVPACTAHHPSSGGGGRRPPATLGCVPRPIALP